MRTALKGVPETVRVQPESVVERDGLLTTETPSKAILPGEGMPSSEDVSNETRELVRDQIF